MGWAKLWLKADGFLASRERRAGVSGHEPFPCCEVPRAKFAVCVPSCVLAGRVGEWLKPADCKSAAPCGLRRFESSPVHHVSIGRSTPEGRETENRILKKVKKTNAPFPGGSESGASSRPVEAWVAQLVERVLGKDEVTGSIPVPGSTWIVVCAGGRTGICVGRGRG